MAASAGEYVSRTDDAGRPIPHICFKVPTGGGKTLLAAAALERLNRQTGLTLWITPTRAIYEQTKAALKSREHPYRHMLERASGGRVKLLEKDDLFTKADVAAVRDAADAAGSQSAKGPGVPANVPGFGALSDPVPGQR